MEIDDNNLNDALITVILRSMFGNSAYNLIN